MTKSKSKYIHALIQAVIFIAVYVITTSMFGDYYLFGWIGHNTAVYFVVAFAVIFTTLTGKIDQGYYGTIANVVGLVAGHFIGEMIRTMNMKKITDGMSPQVIYELHKHYGFFIWIGVFIVLPFIISLARSLGRKGR